MGSREVFEKKTGNKAYGELYGNFDPDYKKMLESQNALMLEVLKTEYKIACTPPVNNSAKERLGNIINQVSGEQI
jgi:hypothetical protein